MAAGRVIDGWKKIAIVGGTGPEGSGLAYRWAKAGLDIVIGSRDAARAKEVAATLRARAGAGAKIDGADNPAAVAQAEIVVLTVPFAGVVSAAEAIEGGVEARADRDRCDGAASSDGGRIPNTHAGRVARVGGGTDAGIVAERNCAGGGTAESWRGVVDGRYACGLRCAGLQRRRTGEERGC